MNKKFLLYFTCFTLPFNMQGVVSYRLLNQWFQASQKRDDALSADQPKPETYRYIPSTSRAQRVQILSEILEKRTPYEAASKRQLQRMINLFTDIGLFANDGEKPYKTIMSRIDRTTSAAGTLALHRMASTNLAARDPELFAKRQAFVQELTHDHELFNKVKGICESWAKHENNFIENWSSGVYEKQSFNDYYYYSKLPFINIKIPCLDKFNHELTLNAGVQCFYNTIVRPTIFNSAVNTISYQIKDRIRAKFDEDFAKSEYSKPPYTKESFGPPPRESYFQSFQKASYDSVVALNPFKDISYIYTTMFGKDNDSTQSIGLPFLGAFECPHDYRIATIKTLQIIGNLYSWYLVYKDVQSHCKRIQYTHEKNIGLSAALEAAESLQQLINEYPILQNAFVSSKELNSLEAETTHNDELVKLISLLKHNNTQKEISMFWDSGHALMAHKLIENDNQKETFTGITEIIGEVDACLSIAKLYKEYNNERAKYCFGKIIDQKNPQFRLKGMWYPLLNAKNAVTNDFAMGGDSKPHGVITGSNTAGKSTSGLKSPLVALWFLHSLGIAPAETCESSRIHTFGSYLHVVDDPASGKSAFKAELDRVGDMVEEIEKLPKDKHAFIVLDELFRGTAPEPAEYGSTKVAEYFSKKSNVLSLLATHFKGVAEKLPHLTGNHANYRVDAEIKEDGTIERDFKIKEGISNTSIASELFKRDLGPIFEPKEKDEDLPTFEEESDFA